jgi:hypothetical protein
MGGEGEFGIGIQIDGGASAGEERRAIGFADRAADEHFGGIEDADDGLTAIELVPLLRVAHGIIPVEILVGDHAGEGRVEFELRHIGLHPFEHDFLAVALELEDAKGGCVATIMHGDRFVEAIDVGAGGIEFDFGFEAIDFGEDGAFAQFDFGFGEIGFSLAQVSGALFGIGAILGTLLIDLMTEVVEFGGGVTGVVRLLGGIEDGDEVTFGDAGAVWDELGEGHGATLTPDLRNEDLGRMDGFDYAGDADFALGAGGIRGGKWRGEGDGGGTAGTGDQEK